MKFVSDSRLLLSNSGVLTGDAARIALRLTRALDIIESQQASMRAAYNDLMNRYDAQACNRLRNELNRQD